MDVRSFGHTWDRHRGVAPELLAAWRVARGLRGNRARFRYSAWVLDYAFTDCGRFRIGSGSSPWQPRIPQTAHLYSPGTVYWEDYRQKTEPVCQSAHIIFLGGEVGGLSRPMTQPTHRARFVDPRGILGRLIEQIAQIGQARKENGFWPAQALFFNVLDHLHTSEPIGKDVRRIRTFPTPVPPSGFVREVNAYLEAHASERVDLAIIARHLHVSISTLAHRYRQETGEPPMSRLIRLRVNRARGLLLGGQPLKAVAAATGFSDAFHLSKTFKRMEGVSPRHFLARLREGSL
ncbi:MAG: helix-turn-helix transcriptional regulator [Planctomycetota bacterium]